MPNQLAEKRKIQADKWADTSNGATEFGWKVCKVAVEMKPCGKDQKCKEKHKHRNTTTTIFANIDKVGKFAIGQVL